ncbi:hypothetical protein F4561_005209 [Lipingzhangella halophila]|uniref:Uncharacterized protein n=1 Tax=Lipingzhangella halophila TaxID=1783352 RepID=A0A7W7RLX3_9ACTN|nr:hypothetical protein [Lipingzhangella halophila]MBB4934389.1 hypothetical protein [Lipingzhangella halophila]
MAQENDASAPEQALDDSAPGQDAEETEPDFEEIGELGGDIINDAAEHGDVGSVVNASSAFTSFPGIYRANGLSSLISSMNSFGDILNQTTSAQRFAANLAKQTTRLESFRTLQTSLMGSVNSARLAQSFFPPVSQTLFDSLTGANEFAASMSALNRRIYWSEFFRNIPDFRNILLPDNLLDIDDDDRLDEVFRIVNEDGMSLAWAPRAEIVVELLDAADRDARDRILENRTLDII